MASVSERPAVCARNPERGRDSSMRSGLYQVEYGREETDSATCGSRPNGSQDIPPEERWQAIAVMAYHLARRRGFVGKPVKYWLAAEAKVDAELATQRSTMM
uniref:DUF2934 domain-containing protein n=1 Tax=Candidatus Kentrum sp. MB TaxID=2138164 RepID=A0A450XNT1_9GAMM|nr:MAG: Protein of unknown function (DUF2934) [Candidatus Kentron sp. MB]VFK30798.1 MAG: Protein of unknown function (DUF2934) [Candidatus Kentron sp. MB]VFK75236.1 MAG: Protein of unknown function (DUF2934) [Candidatus Kentron sp. MB]